VRGTHATAALRASTCVPNHLSTSLPSTALPSTESILSKAEGLGARRAGRTGDTALDFAEVTSGRPFDCSQDEQEGPLPPECPDLFLGRNTG
jgi:hypothetical protein